MQVSITYPDEAKLSLFLKEKQKASYNYKELTGTKNKKVENYDNDHNTIAIGQGELVWENAKSALNNWQQFPDPWTKIYDDSTPLKKNHTVAVSINLFGIWWHNSARIVYDFDENNRYGFAYGTLQGHLERGEECFWIDRDKEGNVFYHIKAFSKPMFWGARLAYPLARKFQRKFVKESMAKMKKLSS